MSVAIGVMTMLARPESHRKPTDALAPKAYGLQPPCLHPFGFGVLVFRRFCFFPSWLRGSVPSREKAPLPNEPDGFFDNSWPRKELQKNARPQTNPFRSRSNATPSRWTCLGHFAKGSVYAYNAVLVRFGGSAMISSLFDLAIRPWREARPVF